MSERPTRFGAVLREGEQVTPLELFFDLVFVLALTQCTALMAADPSWGGILRGLLVLGVLWWSWVGYAWLTSVLDPEEGAVRGVMFAAMAAFLVAALAVPQAFGDDALAFALAYGGVRCAHIGLFLLASRDDPGLRHSVWGLAISTAIGVGLLVFASFLDRDAQEAVWIVALLIDFGGPLLIDASGWRLKPEHYAERHGLIIIIALGESIVAIGAGAEVGVTWAIVAAAVLGIAVAAAQWWLYFDVVVTVATLRLVRATGLEQNKMARDSYSYLHLPMVAGIVLTALGMKKVLVDTGKPLEVEIATALMGGVAMYLLAHVLFRWRNIHTLNRQRLISAFVLLALIPLATEVDALVSLAILVAVLVVLIAYETIRFAELRDRIRHEIAREGVAAYAER